MYQYRVFFQEKLSKRGLITTKKPIAFFTRIQQGEEVILPAHIKQLQDVPKWVLYQETWVVDAVIHQTREAAEKADIIILIPAPVNRLRVLS
jgi:hypothetical protein